MLARFGTLAFLFGLAACASSGGGRPAPRGGGTTRWTGNFRSTGSASSATFGPATPTRGSGSISLIALGGRGPVLTRVELSIRDATPSMPLAWAVFSSDCGSAGPIVAGQNQFPPISVSSSGEGHVKVDIGFALDPRSSYHVNVYFTDRANDMNDIMMCANLRPE